MSLPTRERGLKYIPLYKRFDLGAVAPHAGAWIEMLPIEGLTEASNVAPHAGAWIEIRVVVVPSTIPNVAPHAGAWIEISWFGPYPYTILSLPTRERGLK